MWQQSMPMPFVTGRYFSIGEFFQLQLNSAQVSLRQLTNGRRNITPTARRILSVTTAHWLAQDSAGFVNLERRILGCIEVARTAKPRSRDGQAGNTILATYQPLN